uniref:Lysophosphatidylcholine acyltransferase 4 n=1 Tax=Pelusios castaneus TaxID=367368 RepID=A0A8C8RGM3_9SAUR
MERTSCWDPQGADISPVASQFYLLGAVLAPLRVALAFIVLFLMWPFALLQVLGRSEEELKEPLTGWRSSISHNSICFLSRLMFFLLGFLPPILVAAPHSTFFDPIILLPCDLPKVVSRTENLHVPVSGALLRFNQAILVSRHDPTSRKKVVEEVKRRATSKGKWPQVRLIPRAVGPPPPMLEGSAFIAGVPVQPILVRYPNDLDSTTWAWRGPGVLKVIWLTASQLCTTVEVEFLPVYRPSAEESVSPTVYARNVQQVMARALGVPATDCEILGTLPVRAVGRLRVALEPQLWELEGALERARWVPGADTEGLQPSSGARTLGCRELARWLGLPHPEAPEGLCAYFQQDSGGAVDARVVQLALQALEWGRSPEELTHLAFEVGQDRGWEGSGICRAVGARVSGAVGYFGGMGSICQFQDFALHHPDYAPLFYIYLRPPVAAPHANGFPSTRSKAA